MADPAWLKSVTGWSTLRHYGVRIHRKLDDRIAFLINALDHVRVESIPYQPPAAWFIDAITKDSVVAPIPGTLDAHASSLHGRVHIPEPRTISVVHFHYDHPAGTGQYDLELYRLRPRAPGIPGPGWLDNPDITLIATCSDDGSGGDFHTSSFTFVDEAYKEVSTYDYLVVQATQVMSGGGKEAAGFIDVHFEETTLSRS